jgi:HEAT repeat protein
MPLFGKPNVGPPNIEELKREKNVRVLIKALRYRENADVRRRAAHALELISDARAV